MVDGVLHGEGVCPFEEGKRYSGAFFQVGGKDRVDHLHHGASVLGAAEGLFAAFHAGNQI